MHFLRCFLFILILGGFNKSFAFIEMFESVSEETEIEEPEQLVPTEILEEIAKYKKEAEIYFKES